MRRGGARATTRPCPTCPTGRAPVQRDTILLAPLRRALAVRLRAPAHLLPWTTSALFHHDAGLFGRVFC